MVMHVVKQHDDVQDNRTKICPRCGEVLFADMDTCYGCLFDFTRAPRTDELMLPSSSPLFSDDTHNKENEHVAQNDVFYAHKEDEHSQTAGIDVLDATLILPSVDVELRICSADIDLFVPLPTQGLLIGRSTDCDIHLKSRAVSRNHVRIVKDGPQIVAKDLGATNPAMLKGRELTGEVALKVGDTLDVCGTRLTLVAGRHCA